MVRPTDQNTTAVAKVYFFFHIGRGGQHALCQAVSSSFLKMESGVTASSFGIGQFGRQQAKGAGAAPVRSPSETLCMGSSPLWLPKPTWVSGSLLKSGEPWPRGRLTGHLTGVLPPRPCASSWHLMSPGSGPGRAELMFAH